jgi:hypothetical protein
MRDMKLNVWAPGSLQNLEALRFVEATDETLYYIGALNEVHHLWLEEHEHMPITERGLASLEELQQLEDLRLFGSGFSDAGLARILAARLPLKRVVLVNTGAGRETLAALSRIPSLESLLLIGNSLHDDAFRDLQGFPSLNYLDVDRLGDHGAEWVSRLPALNQLRVHAAEITDAGFRTLCENESLQGVLLDGAPISGKSLQHLADIEHLRGLMLLDCPRLTAEDVVRLPTDLHLKDLFLSCNLYTPASIARIQELYRRSSITTWRTNGQAFRHTEERVRAVSWLSR